MVALFASFCCNGETQPADGPFKLILFFVEGEESLGVVVSKAIIHLLYVRI